MLSQVQSLQRSSGPLTNGQRNVDAEENRSPFSTPTTSGTLTTSGTPTTSEIATSSTASSTSTSVTATSSTAP